MIPVSSGSCSQCYPNPDSAFPLTNPCDPYLPHDPSNQGTASTAWLSSGVPSLPHGGAPFPLGLSCAGSCDPSPDPFPLGLRLCLFL